MRATIETNEVSNNLPPIRVMVALGGEDLSIKVSGRADFQSQRSSSLAGIKIKIF